MKKPYIILIGSASGIGKSTIAAKLAKKLNVNYLIGSDLIREVVRGIIDEDYAPALHYSSYEAYKCLRGKNNFKNKEELIAEGFELHATSVIPALETIINRSVQDNENIIIEGVHLVPGLINLDKYKQEANIFFFILSSNEKLHKERFVKRAVQIKRGGKQLDYFNENRIIHDHLVKTAKKEKIPVINCETIDETVKQIEKIISHSCKTLLLQYGIDDIETILKIIVTKHNGIIGKIEYDLDGFEEPLIRHVNITNEEEINEYLNKFKINPNIKDYLQNIFNLTRYYKVEICTNNPKDLDSIINDLKENNYIYEGIE